MSEQQQQTRSVNHQRAFSQGDVLTARRSSDADEVAAGTPRVRAQAKPLPKWVPDSQATDCMICKRAFGITLRRHHCRNCGRLVCHACSSKTFALPSTSSIEPVRVCDTCYVDLSAQAKQNFAAKASAGTAVIPSDVVVPESTGSTSSPAVTPTAALAPGGPSGSIAGAKGATGDKESKGAAASNPGSSAGGETKHGGAAHGAGEKFSTFGRQRAVHIPEWAQAVRPLTDKGRHVGVGRLVIKLVGAVNVPAMDGFGSANPYCTLRLGDQRLKTTAATRTLTPQWGQEFSLEVPHVGSQLQVAMYSQDEGGRDQYIGECQIAVADLSASRQTNEFTLQVSQQVQDEARRSKRKASRAQEGDITPKIFIETQLTFSKIGEFLSYFSTESPQPPMEFHQDIMWTQIWRLIALLTPVLLFFRSMRALIGWNKPVSSIAMIASWLLIALNPWSLTVLVQLFLIRYMIWQYVYRTWEQKGEDERAKARGVQVSAEEKRSGHGHRASEPPQLNMIVQKLARSSIAGAGMHRPLEHYQNFIIGVCDTLQAFYESLQWRNPSVTRSVLILLIGTTIYSMFMPQRYLFFIIGTYILTAQTAAGKSLTIFVSGLWRIVAGLPPAAATQPHTTTHQHWHRALTAAAAVNALEQAGENAAGKRFSASVNASATATQQSAAAPVQVQQQVQAPSSNAPSVAETSYRDLSDPVSPTSAAAAAGSSSSSDIKDAPVVTVTAPPSPQNSSSQQGGPNTGASTRSPASTPRGSANNPAGLPLSSSSTPVSSSPRQGSGSAGSSSSQQPQNGTGSSLMPVVGGSVSGAASPSNPANTGPLAGPRRAAGPVAPPKMLATPKMLGGSDHVPGIRSTQ